MKKIIFILLLSSVFTIGAAAQNESNLSAKKDVSANFKSDGCSMFPDGDYCDCCAEHDRAYYAGGSWKQRWRADKQLFKCVAGKKGWWHKPLAPVMWTGVRVGGLPFLPTAFRWGFGAKKSKKKAGETQTGQEQNKESKHKESKKDDLKTLDKASAIGLSDTKKH